MMKHPSIAFLTKLAQSWVNRDNGELGWRKSQILFVFVSNFWKYKGGFKVIDTDTTT